MANKMTVFEMGNILIMVEVVKNNLILTQWELAADQRSAEYQGRCCIGPGGKVDCINTIG